MIFWPYYHPENMSKKVMIMIILPTHTQQKKCSGYTVVDIVVWLSKHRFIALQLSGW